MSRRRDFRITYTPKHGARVLIWNPTIAVWMVADRDVSLDALVARFERSYSGIRYDDNQRDSGSVLLPGEEAA